MIDSLSGGQWTTQEAPQPADAASEQAVILEGVSCPSTGGCAAIGLFETSSGAGAELLTQAGPGGAWSATDAPVPSDAITGSGAISEAEAVSCGPAAACEAVGIYAATGDTEASFVDRLTGGTWTSTTAPVPANAGTGSDRSSELLSVSCTFDGCQAVGTYEDATTGDRALAVATDASGHSTAVEAPQPPDAATGSSADGFLEDVSCQSLSSCVAVGSYANPVASENVALIDTLSGGTWNALASPVPANAASGSGAESELRAVSCPSGGGCGAGGDFFDPGDQFGLLVNNSPSEGYWTDASDGGIFSYGNATFHGSMGGQHLNKPVVGMAVTPGGGGYWEVASDGGIFSFGDANFYGSTGSLHLNAPVVGMAASPDGGGYWLVASDGGIFNYGDAGFFGSAGSIHLNQPIVGMAATPDGGGYWLVASDGGIFSYGDAQFYGSRGGQPLNKPIVGMAASATGLGYWLVASDGGIFTYGDATFQGSSGSLKLNKPVVGMMSTFDGAGYWLVASDGGIFSYGDAVFQGSAGSLHLNAPMVGGTPT